MNKPKSSKISVTINPVRQRILYADINAVEEGHRAARLLELAAYALAVIHGQTAPLFAPQVQASSPQRQPPAVAHENEEVAVGVKPNTEVAAKAGESVIGGSGHKDIDPENLEKPLLSNNNKGVIYGSSVPHRAIRLDIDPNDI
jgi:hypothetical protein